MDVNNKASPGISTNEAMDIIKKKGFQITRTTLIKWIIDYEMGKKVFGRWYIDKDKLMFYLRYGEDMNKYR